MFTALGANDFKEGPDNEIVDDVCECGHTHRHTQTPGPIGFDIILSGFSIKAQSCRSSQTPSGSEGSDVSPYLPASGFW